MRNFRVIQGGASAATNRWITDSSADIGFGLPPNLYIGLFGATLGGLCGLLSLVVFFAVWPPYPYITAEWLVFLGFGIIIGFFLRFERPWIELIRRKAA